MKGKKILTGLLCAAVAGNLVAGVAPGMMCDVSAASAQTSIEQKKVVQTTKELEQKRYNGVPGDGRRSNSRKWKTSGLKSRQ